MSATLLQFVRPQKGWSNEERAQFSRIQHLLADAGMDVEFEEGETDEGEPWCVFCSVRADEVVIHIARIDGQYVLDSPALDSPIEAHSVEACAQRFVDDAAMLRRERAGRQVHLHPSAMLAGVALTLFLYVEAASRYHGLTATDDICAEDPETKDGSPEAGFLHHLKLLAQQVAESLSFRSDEERARPSSTCVSVVSANATALAVAYELGGLFERSDRQARLQAESVASDSTARESDVAENATAERQMRESATRTDAVEEKPIETASAKEQGDAAAANATPVVEARRVVTPDDAAFDDAFDADTAATVSPGSGTAEALEPVALSGETANAAAAPAEFAPELSGEQRSAAMLVAEMILQSLQIAAIEEVALEALEINAVEPFEFVAETAPEEASLPSEPEEARVYSLQEAFEFISEFVRLTGSVSQVMHKEDLYLYDDSVLEMDFADSIGAEVIQLEDSTITFVAAASELEVMFA